MKRRILCLFLVVNMLLPLMPLHVNAASFKYGLFIKTADVTNAGTDSSVYAGFGFYNDSEVSDICDLDGVNDHERNDGRLYEFTKEMQAPWMINQLFIQLDGADDWNCEYVQMAFPNIGGTTLIYRGKIDYNDWTKGKGKYLKSVASITQRMIQSYPGLDAWHGIFYLDKNTSSTLQYNWNRNISDQYGVYNCMLYEDAPEMSYSLSNSGVGTGWFSFTPASATQDASLSINQKSLYDAMAGVSNPGHHGIGSLTLTVKLAFSKYSTSASSAHLREVNNQLVKESVFTFYRSCFQLGEASISQTQTYSPRQDFNYLNRQYKDVTITIEPTSIHCGAITAEQKQELADNFQCTSALYLGNSTSDKLCEMIMTKSGGTLTFKGQVPMDKSGSLNDGVMLHLENVSSSYSGRTYMLESGEASRSYYFPTHKVDTKAPSVRLTDKDGKEISIQNAIRAQHKFYNVSNETLYPEANSSHTESNQKYLQYELYQKNGETYGISPVNITGYLGSGSTTKVMAPVNTTVLTDAEICLMPAEPTEGQYKLRIYGWDDANNGLNPEKYGVESFCEIENIYLDRQAPRVSVTETVQNQAVDGTKRNDYTFAITDLQSSHEFGSWARAYYCFVADGQQMPDPGMQAIGQSTGEIEVTAGKWAFVEGGSDTTTAVLKVQKAETFEGKLYYYTADSAGNDSRTENSNAYFSKEVKIYNYDTRDTLVTEPYTYPKSSYNIAFDRSDSNYSTEYRWKSNDDATFSQNFTPYTGVQEVGAAQQTGSDGKSRLFDGNYALEYKVTEQRSGNWRIYTRDYVFDNVSPKIKTTWLTGNSQLLQTQQLKLEIDDVSGVESATYCIVNPDGTPIDGYAETPVTITRNADNRGTVNETLTFSLPVNGVYGLQINAVDKNGLISDIENLNFGIRNEKPQMTALNHNLNDLVDGCGATANGNYSVIVNVTDLVKNASALQSNQDVRYCISANGMDYSGWITAGNVEKETGIGSIHYSVTLENPLMLAEGWSTVYIKTACVNGGNQDDPKSSVVSDAQTIRLLYDNKPPEFDMPSYSTINWTKEDVTAVIKASDAATGVCTLTVQNSGANIEISPYADGQFMVTIKENLTEDLVLADSLGNQTLVPLNIANIDKSLPVTKAVSESLPSGARTDGKVEITIVDQTDVQTSFALVKDPTESQELTEADFLAFSASRVSVEQSDTQINDDGLMGKKYTLWLRGLDGTYAIGLKSTDIVGNTTEVLFTDKALTLTDAEPKIVEMACSPMITKSTTIANLAFNVPLVVLPNPQVDLSKLSETQRENYLSAALLEVDDEFVTEYSVVCQSAEPVSIFVMDEVRRTAILSFKPDAEFIAGFDISAYVEKNGQTIPNGGFISFLPEDTISYIVNPSTNYEKQLFFADLAEYSGMQLNEQRSVIDAVYEGGGTPVAYTSLCFDVLHDGKTTKFARFNSYTFEGNENERMEEEYLAISVVDETVPKGSVTYSETKPTNKNVTATITMSDSESGIVKLEKSYDGGNTYEITSAITQYNEEFEENGTVHFRLTNGAGMTSIVTATVANIDKTAIIEGTHYTVDYSYENYLGEWIPITPGKAYRRVMAVVNPIPNTGKVLSATNNGGSFTRMLTASDSRFSFTFRDEAGNTGYKEVEYTLFDNQPGTTTWLLSNKEKTNKNISATLTVTDETSGIAHVEVKKDGVVYPFTGPLEDEYTVELDSSGAYHVTAYDGAGNSWTEVISVSNIDKTTPEVLTKLYSTPIGTITTRSVRVELTEFNKNISTIKITGIELVSGLTSQDIVYTPGEKGIRFKKNGSVAVKFIDEYGNEGFEVVTVSNICTDPPAVEAVAVLAADQLSVNVTFDKMLDKYGVPVDKYRELSDLMVTYKGITYKLEAASFTLKNNGTYEFIVHDSSGASQKILLKVTGIDDRAPVITEIRWEYKYHVENQNGVWEEKTHSRAIEPGTDTSALESGYRVAADKNNPETNQNVNVTVTTNKETAFIGGKDALSLKKAMEYRENGLFSFNLQARNSTSATYGVDIELIDKKPPVITLDNGPELIFIEGMSKERDPMYAYDKAKLMDFHAYDIKDGVQIDLTDKVRISYGIGGRVFDPDNISSNEFVRGNPYYVEYTVYDIAGNGTTLRRTIRLVGFYDTIALVNGKIPDSTNVATVVGDKIQISLKNFSGIAYARYDKGIFTQGQMKTRGIPLTQRNGIFTVDKSNEGWYTVYIQTDKRDYFNIQVYVVPQNEESQGGSK